MKTPEQYPSDVLFFFEGKPAELALYQALEERLAQALPETEIRVQKSQISFYGRHLFAAVSLPRRRGKGWPERCLVVSFGLNRPLASARVAALAEPYPGRWTHHVPVAEEGELDGELMGWLKEAFAFSQSKR